MKRLIIMLLLISLLIPIATSAFIATHGSQVLIEFDTYSNMSDKVYTKMYRLYENVFVNNNVNNYALTSENFYTAITNFIDNHKTVKIIYSYNPAGELDNVVIFYIK